MSPKGSFFCLSIFICRNPNRKCLVLGSDNCRRGIDHDNRALADEISALIRACWELRAEIACKASMSEALGSIPNALTHTCMLVHTHTLSPWKAPLSLHHVTETEDGHLCSRKQNHNRHRIFWNFILGLLDPQNCMWAIGLACEYVSGGRRPASSFFFYSSSPYCFETVSLNL